MALQTEVVRCRHISNEGGWSADTGERVLTVAPARPPAPSVATMATEAAMRLIASRKGWRSEDNWALGGAELFFAG